MKKILFIIFGFFLFIGFSSENQNNNYIEYHRAFGAIESLIVNEHFEAAELKLDSLFMQYEVKFAKDYVVAAQVALLNGHKEKAINYIYKSIKKGVKISCLKRIRLLKDQINEQEWKFIEDREKQLKKDYLKSINLEWYQEFHQRYQAEQDAKRKPEYKAVVYSNFNRIKQLIDTVDFVGENNIGIDNHRLANSISDCDFGNAKVIVTLLHYDFPISEIGIDRMIKAIENGNLHPIAFATIYNFEKNKISVLYKSSYKRYGELPEYNFNFPFGSKIDNFTKVNADRWKFGICKYEVDLKKEEIYQKFGLKLEFDY